MNNNINEHLLRPPIQENFFTRNILTQKFHYPKISRSTVDANTHGMKVILVFVYGIISFGLVIKSFNCTYNEHTFTCGVSTWCKYYGIISFGQVSHSIAHTFNCTSHSIVSHSIAQVIQLHIQRTYTFTCGVST